MAAFSILRPDELGWDPTMRLYCPPPTLSPLPYLIDFEIDKYGGSVYDTHWEIEMPGKGGSGPRETFVTVKCLSALQADGAYGRGTCPGTVRPSDQRTLMARIPEREIGFPLGFPGVGVVERGESERS